MISNGCHRKRLHLQPDDLKLDFDKVMDRLQQFTLTAFQRDKERGMIKHWCSVRQESRLTSFLSKNYSLILLTTLTFHGEMNIDTNKHKEYRVAGHSIGR